MKKKWLLPVILSVAIVLTVALGIWAASQRNTHNSPDQNNDPETTVDKVLEETGTQSTENIQEEVPEETQEQPSESSQEELAAREPLSRLSRSDPAYVYMDFREVVREKGVRTDETATWVVPVYYETDLLFDVNNGYDLGQDASRFDHFGSQPHSASGIISDCPTDAIRVRTNRTVYIVYDTDQGTRLYLFFGSFWETADGFPLVINRVMSYEDFKNIEIGDTIDDVAAVDDVTELYKKHYYDNWQLSYIAAKSMCENGYPPTTLHYLEDGILKIEYEMLEDRTLVVSSITYNEKYWLTCYDGDLLNYKIEDADLPTNEYQ